ncbi:uncharacterized protein LOC107364502 [Tetranychus urticae]|uniref:Uncharacterized protein n=1 Tax=Tetranychus urticae TaxID=32264 RepID=T1KJ60_TETUR|nr:uncharacterized protein LOC107364502 [Tetranychus urticae]
MSYAFDQHDLADVAVKGVFCVKLPPNVRSTGAWKVWSPKLLVIKPQTSEINGRHASRSNNKLILTIFKSSKMKDTSQGFVIQEILNPSRTIIFRCKSRKKPHAFTIYGDGKPMVHISGDSETESQLLIKSIRNLLWPPNPILSLSKTLGSFFEVSIIDNEISYRAGLLGVCGYLTITSEKVSLTCPQTGHVIQEWSMSAVSFRLVPQLNLKDNNKVVNMKTNENSSTGIGNILIYCEEASELIIQANRVRSSGNIIETTYSDELFQNFSLSLNEFDLTARFDDLWELNGSSKSPSQSISDRSSFTPVSSTRYSYNQSTSYSLSSSLSTNRSSAWLESSDIGIYDVPRPTNPVAINQSSNNGYASIIKPTNQQSILNTIPDLPSSVLDCSLNSKQWMSAELDYNSYSPINLATSLPTAVEILQDDHIYEEIRGMKAREERDELLDDGEDDIYEIIEPLRQTLFEEAENINPKKEANQLDNDKFNDEAIIGVLDDGSNLNENRPKSKSIPFNANTQCKNLKVNQLKSSPKGISRFNYFKLRRTLSESWPNQNRNQNLSP